MVLKGIPGNGCTIAIKMQRRLETFYNGPICHGCACLREVKAKVVRHKMNAQPVAFFNGIRFLTGAFSNCKRLRFLHPANGVKSLTLASSKPAKSTYYVTGYIIKIM